MKYIKTTSSQNVLTVALNRPERRNAFDAEMIKEMTEVFTELNGDKKLRAVVLTGEGKSFCSGGDLEWMKSMADFTPAQNLKDADKLFSMFWAVRECPVPVIGRVFGHCFGGGAGLTAACDIVAAESETLFSFSEVKYGLAPAVISPFVVEKIPPSRLNEWFMTAKVFKAPEALSGGLVNFCGDLAAVDKFVDETLMNILGSAPGAVRDTKKLLRSYSKLSWKPVRGQVTKLIAKRRSSDEGQKGLQAFLNKQTPKWSDSINVPPAKI
jgi:methylglutaconyl-CoA hydratase